MRPMATLEAEDFIRASTSPPLMAPVKTRTGWLVALLHTAPHQALGSLMHPKGRGLKARQEPCYLRMKRERAPVQGCPEPLHRVWMCPLHIRMCSRGWREGALQAVPLGLNVQIKGNDKSAATSGRVASGTPDADAYPSQPSHPDRQPCQQRPHITELDEGMEEQPRGHSTSSWEPELCHV